MTNSIKYEAKPRAAIYSHDRFILVRTRSGFRSTWDDPQGESIYLSSDASDFILGEALVKALAASRMFTVENFPRLTREQTAECYEIWVETLKARYAFKTRKALFEPMKNVWAEQYPDLLALLPTKHEKLEGWGRSKSDGIEDVLITYPNTRDAIGNSIRIALDRCR